MNHAFIMWMRSNWKRIAGLPAPDEDAWILQDTVLSNLQQNEMFSVLQKLDDLGVIERGKRARRTRADGSKINVRSWYTDRHKWEQILGHKSVNSELMTSMASDPSADVHVVDVFPSDASKRGVRAVCEVLDGVKVQAVAVSESRVDSYPGDVVVVDNVDDIMSVVTRADVVVANTVLPRWPLGQELAVSGDVTVLNPVTAADVVDEVDRVVGTYSVEDDVGRRESRDDDQLSLLKWDPGVKTVENVVIEEPGQQSLTTYS